MQKATTAKLDAIVDKVLKNPTRFVYEENLLDFPKRKFKEDFSHSDKVYFEYFKSKPNKITFNKIDREVFYNKIHPRFNNEITNINCVGFDDFGEKYIIELILWNTVLVEINEKGYGLEYYVRIVFYFGNQENARVNTFCQTLAKIIQKSIKTTKLNRPQVYHYSSYRRTYERKFIKENHLLDLNKNYNDDILDFHQNLVLKFNKIGSGLVILHGDSGTGKSYYLRHLMGCLNRSFVVIPSQNLFEFTFNNMVLDFVNTIFIIDNADSIFSEINTNVISFLRNLSDGILSDYFNCQIILVCRSIENLDKILARKGRLIDMYEFKKLSRDKTINLLSRFINKSYANQTPMKLSEIYKAIELDYGSIIYKNPYINILDSAKKWDTHVLKNKQ